MVLACTYIAEERDASDVVLWMGVTVQCAVGAVWGGSETADVSAVTSRISIARAYR